jgi:hypothetical protein
MDEGEKEKPPDLEEIGEANSSDEDEESLMWKEWNSCEFTVNYKKYIKAKKNAPSKTENDNKTHWTVNEFKGKNFCLTEDQILLEVPPAREKVDILSLQHRISSDLNKSIVSDTNILPRTRSFLPRSPNMLPRAKPDPKTTALGIFSKKQRRNLKKKKGRKSEAGSVTFSQADSLVPYQAHKDVNFHYNYYEDQKKMLTSRLISKKRLNTKKDTGASNFLTILPRDGSHPILSNRFHTVTDFHDQFQQATSSSEQQIPIDLDNHLFSTDKLGQMIEWNIEKNSIIRDWGKIHNGAVNQICIVPKKNLFFTVGSGNSFLKKKM